MDDDAKARVLAEHRAHLHRVAHRMLGSSERADDAVQETWLRLQSTDVDGVASPGAWLTTVVSRVCLDMLRSAAARREAPVQALPELPAPSDPERDAMLADAAGRALLVLLERLSPAERVAFVLHDVFAVPFGEIAPVLERSGEATKKLAARARSRVRAGGAHGDPAAHRPVVDAFLAAIRVGDMGALLAVLAPDVVRRVDPVLLPAGAPAEVRGAQAVVAEARTLSGPAREAVPALVEGRPGGVVVRDGRPVLVIALEAGDEGVIAFEVIGDPVRLAALAVVVTGHDLAEDLSGDAG